MVNGINSFKEWFRGYDILSLTTLLRSDVKTVLPDVITSDMVMFLSDVDQPEIFTRTAAAYGLTNA